MARTQLGLRLSDAEASELRAAARERRMTLGELVTTLLRESRADAGRGIWIELEPATQRALDAVAGASGETREQALQRMTNAWLAGQLEDLLAGLGADPTERQAAAQLPPEPAPAPRVERRGGPEVGLFTVSED
jgi:hypothetical protein